MNLKRDWFRVVGKCTAESKRGSVTRDLTKSRRSFVLVGSLEMAHVRPNSSTSRIATLSIEYASRYRRGKRGRCYDNGMRVRNVTLDFRERTRSGLGRPDDSCVFLASSLSLPSSLSINNST